MSQDISFIKQTLKNCVSVDSPYDLLKDRIINYITLKNNQEYFFNGFMFEKMANNRVILMKNGKRTSVQLDYFDKDGIIYYQTRLFMEDEEKVPISKYEKIINNQQSIIEKTKQLLENIQNENKELSKENDKLRDENQKLFLQNKQYEEVIQNLLDQE